MVATFLLAEIDSPRFKKGVEDFLEKRHLNSDLIFKPNLNSLEENKIRNEILTSYRGYGNRLHIFTNFPKNIKWYRVELNKNEISQIKYINYDYWNEISDNTRLANAAAKNINLGKVVFGESNNNFLEAAKDFKLGKKFPEVILVGRDQENYLVVLEGHLRLTAMALASEKVPDNITALVGFSEEITKWGFY